MNIRNNCIATLAATLLVPVGCVSAQNYLTDIGIFSSDSSGSYTTFPNSDNYDTRPTNSYPLIFDTFIQQGAPGGGGSFLNGPDAAHARPNISMAAGSDTLTLFGAPGANANYFGINLYFNGSTTPSISAFGPMLTAQGPHSFTADSSLSTSGISSSVPGAGTLTFTANGQQVTLTDFFWAEPSVYNLDEVSAFALGPGGANNYVGGISFSVVQVPEPAFSIWGLGLAFGAFSIWRRSAGKN
jgi:hypothetical protein